MLKTLINAFKVPDLRKKMIFTVVLLVLYRFGAVVPVPYISADSLNTIMNQSSGLFQFMSIMSGGAFSRATLFALSIQPYITASIVMQLLGIAIPALEKLQKEGEEGRKIITQWTRAVTVALGLITAIGYYLYMKKSGVLTEHGTTFLGAIVIIASYSAGAALIMWLGEKINENGLGNGISLILFVNIVSGAPTLVGSLYALFTTGVWHAVLAELLIVLVLAAVVFVVFVTNSERRLPVQYAKKVVGRKMYGGQSTSLPLKLNMAGVMPIIFASSIVAIPSTIFMFFDLKKGTFWYNVSQALSQNSILYAIFMFILIIAFSYFYIGISFNPVEVSNNLKKNGGFIQGIRPGKPTAMYIRKVLNRITLIGALFLSIVAVGPLLINIFSKTSLGSIAFGGSSLLIVVGVALETATTLEAQMTMRHYKGFLE